WFLPALGCFLVNGPVGIGGITAAGLQAPPDQFGVGLAEQKDRWHCQACGSLQKGPAPLVLTKAGIDDHPVALKESLLRPAQALGIGAFRPGWGIDPFPKWGASRILTCESSQLFAHQVRTDEAEVGPLGEALCQGGLARARQATYQDKARPLAR